MKMYVLAVSDDSAFMIELLKAFYTEEQALDAKDELTEAREEFFSKVKEYRKSQKSSNAEGWFNILCESRLNQLCPGINECWFPDRIWTMEVEVHE